MAVQEMKYCYECGTKLEMTESRDEGPVPWCPVCGVHRFPIFNTAVSMEVMNPAQDSLILIQQYGRQRNVLVAGYINRGERAEDAVAREIKEEIGVDVRDITFNESQYFAKSNTLMLNFYCTALTEDLSGFRRQEVDRAAWFPLEEAMEAIAQGSLAQHFLDAFLKKRS